MTLKQLNVVVRRFWLPGAATSVRAGADVRSSRRAPARAGTDDATPAVATPAVALLPRRDAAHSHHNPTAVPGGLALRPPLQPTSAAAPRQRVRYCNEPLRAAPRRRLAASVRAMLTRHAQHALRASQAHLNITVHCHAQHALRAFQAHLNVTWKGNQWQLIFSGGVVTQEIKY